jgi:hypothetical protein
MGTRIALCRSVRVESGIQVRKDGVATIKSHDGTNADTARLRFQPESQRLNDVVYETTSNAINNKLASRQVSHLFSQCELAVSGDKPGHLPSTVQLMQSEIQA